MTKLLVILFITKQESSKYFKTVWELANSLMMITNFLDIEPTIENELQSPVHHL